MRLGVLFSGGKDSNYAMYKASKKHKIKVLISIFSENEDSYMFHTPEIENVKVQSKKLNIPLLIKETKGIKEKELEDLKKAIREAIKEYKIEGVVTGAIASNYQVSRIQEICDDLKIECVNPLWGISQLGLLKNLIKYKFKVKIVKVAADGLDDSWIGKVIDENVIEDLVKLNEKNKINIAGEGGEYESIVIDSPMFKAF